MYKGLDDGMELASYPKRRPDYFVIRLARIRSDPLVPIEGESRSYISHSHSRNGHRSLL